MNPTLTPFIRDLTAQDLPAVLQLYQASFPDEMRAADVSPQDLQKQYKALMVGNMVPFKVLARLTRLSWAWLVAEVAGQVVGIGGFRGSSRTVEFGPLMILPEHRRQGIGAALTQARLARAAQMGIIGVRVGSLITNQASLGNLAKHGFTPYRYRTSYEVALPWAQTIADAGVSIRLAQTSDKEQLKFFETRALGKERLEREGSRLEFFCPSWAHRVALQWLAKSTRVALIAEQAGQIVATAEVSAQAQTPKGQVLLEKDSQLASEAVELMLLRRAANWLTQQGKRAMQVMVPGQVEPPAFALAENRYCGVYLFRRLEKA